jgi:hypothetical protein
MGIQVQYDEAKKKGVVQDLARLALPKLSKDRIGIRRKKAQKERKNFRSASVMKSAVEV